MINSKKDCAICKGILACAKQVKVHNQKTLQRQSLITICNHLSTVDDPAIWGAALPLRTLFQSNKMRWTMGAKEIMFNNKIDSWYFGNGKVIPTVRGAGIFQESVDIAIAKMNEGQWVHMFPEGYVNQTGKMRRFKWGVGRMIESSEKAPWILPIYIKGFDQMMPEGKVYIPKPFGKEMHVYVGDVITDVEEMRVRAMREAEGNKTEAYRVMTAELQEIMQDMADRVEIEHKEK
ncbi:hypothetical protein PROFUN_13289 [Planoprotostelium fungivorum]|uniref:Tafazzin family protein n=1 Tax=Planoprotostelium fungivorum TaxID=1890364 RepID=A0A2P6N4P6_9EUKA|nr:hypothetical protein PROFUN_13289 [Planoprotostelium fungivorum]